MLRSFRLKFFVLTTVAVVSFALVTRVTVRNFSSQNLHDLMYSNFSGYLALNVKDLSTPTTVFKSQNGPQSNELVTQVLEKQVAHYFPNASVSEQQIWVGGFENQMQKNMLTGIQWRDIHGTQNDYLVQFSETRVSSDKWALFKTPYGQHHLYVAIHSRVFQSNFEGIMDARESVVNSMWPVLLVYIFLCTWILTFWVMRSLNHLQNKFKNIELKNSDTVLLEKDFDHEFSNFVSYFNLLIKRLRFNFEQASRFSSDAAHELRTPLTVIRGNLKRLLNTAPDNSLEQKQLSMLSDEVERLISITNKLVMLSQADGGSFQLELKELNLLDVIGIIRDDIQSLMPDIQFQYDMSPEIKILADPNLFQQLINNLVSNAIKYSPANGKIHFKAETSGDQTRFSIANETYLSLEGLDERVFQRFYRHLDDPNSGHAKTRGDGLGLSLCQEIAKAHGGTLTLQTGPEKWVTFTSTWKSA